MNPFVNPKKRSISLRRGCKNLADVLQPSQRKGIDPVQTFIALLLMQAHQHHATQLVIGAEPAPGGESTLVEKIGDSDCHVSTVPSEFRSLIVAELSRMAAISVGQFPKDGSLAVLIERTQLKWMVRIASPDGEYILTPVIE